MKINIDEFMANEEAREMMAELKKELGKEIKNTLLIGALTRGAFKLKSIGFKESRRNSSKKRKSEEIVITIDVQGATKRVVSKIVKETGKTFAVGAATRVGTEVLKVSKGMIKNGNENLMMHGRRFATVVEEFEKNE